MPLGTRARRLTTRDIATRDAGSNVEAKSKPGWKVGNATSMKPVRICMCAVTSGKGHQHVLKHADLRDGPASGSLLDVPMRRVRHSKYSIH